MSHTPGPWRKSNVSDAIISENNKGLPPHAFEESKKYYGGYVIAETVASCNMPLLLAAPDLFNSIRYFIMSITSDPYYDPQLPEQLLKDFVEVQQAEKEEQLRVEMANDKLIKDLLAACAGEQEVLERTEKANDELRTAIDLLTHEREWLQTNLINLQNQMQIDGHASDCASAQTASVDCSCGARQTDLIEQLQAENIQLKEILYTLYTRLHRYEDGSWAEINFNLWQSLMDCQLLAQLVETSEAHKGKWQS